MPASIAQAETETRRAASLRRIAIVLRDLPDAVATQLLSELHPETRQRLRHEVMSLADVDPLERKRALESFSGSVKRQANRHSDEQRTRFESPDEIVFSQASQAASSYSRSGGNPSSMPAYNRSSGPASDPNLGSMRFLEQISDDDLLSLLRDERPQTQAVVLASISPSRAAAILPQIDGGQRRELLSRIGRLEELPGDMLADLADSFRQRVERLRGSRDANPLQSLIDAYGGGEPVDPARAASHVPSGAARVSPRLQAILAEMPPTRATTPTNTRFDNGHSNQSTRPESTRPESNRPAPNRADAAMWDRAMQDRTVGDFASDDSSHGDWQTDDEAARAAQRLRRITRGDDEPARSIRSDASASISPMPTNRQPANPTMPTGQPANQTADRAPRPADRQPQSAEPPVDLSTDAIHQELVGMPAKRLCEALGRVGTRTAILTLCGLPNRTADAAIACLPRVQANQVRQHLMSLGSMEIWEIDEAKQQVYMAARTHGRLGGDPSQPNPASSPARQEVAIAS